VIGPGQFSGTGFQPVIFSPLRSKTKEVGFLCVMLPCPRAHSAPWPAAACRFQCRLFPLLRFSPSPSWRQPKTNSPPRCRRNVPAAASPCSASAHCHGHPREAPRRSLINGKSKRADRALTAGSGRAPETGRVRRAEKPIHDGLAP